MEKNALLKETPVTDTYIQSFVPYLQNITKWASYHRPQKFVQRQVK